MKTKKYILALLVAMSAAFACSKADIDPATEETSVVVDNGSHILVPFSAEALAFAKATDGVEYSLDIAKEYIKTAKESLPESLTPEVRECFVTAADFVGDRHF